MSPEVLIALIGVVGTLLGTLGGALLSNRAATKREDRQWKRQINEQRRSEALKACEDYIAGTAMFYDNPQVELAPLWRSLAIIEILAPKDVADKAKALDFAITEIRPAFIYAETTDAESKQKLVSKTYQAHANFIAAIRKEYSDLAN